MPSSINTQRKLLPTDSCPRCGQDDAPGTPPGGDWWDIGDRRGQWYCRHCNWKSDSNNTTKPVQSTEPSKFPWDQRTGTDCVRCCVAALLEVPYDIVPDFLAEHDLQWAAGVANWAQKVGYNVLRFQACGAGELIQSLNGSDILWIATGPTSRGTDHAVIYKDDSMVYDPHESRSGILEITGALLIMRAPSKRKLPFKTP